MVGCIGGSVVLLVLCGCGCMGVGVFGDGGVGCDVVFV